MPHSVLRAQTTLSLPSKQSSEESRLKAHRQPFQRVVAAGKLLDTQSKTKEVFEPTPNQFSGDLL